MVETRIYNLVIKVPMNEIFSRENAVFKLCKSLEQKKNRDRSGKFLIEGENAVAEGTKRADLIERVLVKSGYEERFRQIIDDFEDDRVSIISAELFEALTQTETSQGIIALANKPSFSVDDFYACYRDFGNKNFIVLDRLQDPGNIGTIIRTAEAAGYGLIISVKGTVDAFSPKVVRSTAGAILRMPIISVDSIDRLTEMVRLSGRRLVAASMGAETAYFDADLRENVAIIVGNEGNGVSEELLSRSDLKISIPMMGNTESLNVAVAAGLLMYEALRKRA